MSKLIDLTGKKFGRLNVLRRVENKLGKPCWECICDCGTIRNITSAGLRKGTQSCGCYVKDKNKEIQSTHKKSGTREYDIWHSMKGRCLNPKHHAYKDYGGRGITICEKWMEFQGFWEDMQEGYIKNLTLDRKENDRGYFKENCRWATRGEQSNNTRTVRQIYHNGVMKTISQLSKEYGINYYTLWSRFDYGWPIEKALSTH